MNPSNLLAIAVLGIGSTQMLGYLTGSRILRGIGLASGVAPFPKVFCEADGYEAFAASFHLEGVRPDGTRWTCPLDPERYARIKGPYNRRNVHGATLAFAPRLPDDLRASLISSALCPDSDLRRELDIPADLTDLRVIITPRPDEPHGPWSCNTHGELTEIR
ncbi:hypothetical protein [Haloferula rosea]|uniref:Uncharacterized protein n=1 Tax=Haloferula rosea TaxID=490093 RepID=A0A934VFI4_9BACT|nr:hypothetical protein [Haloferula rosea]MBK1826610.1 hypothetical protein [Haloferula rosea]